MSIQASTAIREQMPLLAERVVDNIYRRQRERWGSYGEEGRVKSVRDTGYHLRYLAEALAADDPALYTEYLAWVKVLFAGLNFSPSVLTDSLAEIHTVISESVPENVRSEILEILESGQRGVVSAPIEIPSFIDGNGDLDQLARDFLAALLDGNRRRASEMILAAVKGGTSVKEIYAQVFERTQREVGRLWQTNSISVAQEHFCTAATQMVMSQLYPYIFTGQRTGRRMVMACVGGELHEIGARMVADFFEMEGWDTYFVGANMPATSVLQSVDELQADVLAISATMTFHVSQVAEMIHELRTTRGNQRTRVLVGGFPFNLAPQLWQKMGADGFARDAAAALQEAERVLAE